MSDTSLIFALTVDPDAVWPDWAGDPDPDIRASWRDFLARNPFLDDCDRRFLARLIDLGIQFEDIGDEYDAYHQQEEQSDTGQPSGYCWSEEAAHLVSIEMKNPPPPPPVPIA